MWYKQFESKFVWRYHRWHHRSTFKSKYGSINMVLICGILPSDYNWSVNGVYMKDVNQMLKIKCTRSCFTFIFQDSVWTLWNGLFDPDLFYLDNVHLVENANLKLAESICYCFQTERNKWLVYTNSWYIFTGINRGKKQKCKM